jgi:hypothetical protein
LENGARLNWKNSNKLSWILVVFLAFCCVAGLTWVNYSFSKNNPGGNDFLVHYVGTRSFLLEGLSPYSDEVAIRIQTAAYGHPAQGEEHELRVAYPLYSIFLFLPFSLIENYVFARAVWMTTLELALIILAFVAMNLAGWKPHLWLQGVILLFSLIWYHAIRGLVNGNAVILVALMLAVIFLLIRDNKDRPAGFLLAISTIKPQLVVLLIPFVIIWSLYQKRWTLLRWFFGTLSACILIGIILIPDWILQNLWEILKYPAYNPAGTLAVALAEWSPRLESPLKWGIFIALGVLLIYEWWTGRKSGFERFLWVAFLTITISQWIGIQTDPGNFIILFPAIILILSTWDKRWKAKGALIVSSALAALFFGLWFLFIMTIQKSYQPIQSPVMFIPLPAISLLGLYWIKWWVINPARSYWIESK